MQPRTAGLHLHRASLAAGLHNGHQLPLKRPHLRLLEGFQVGGVAVADGPEAARAAYHEAERLRCVGVEIILRIFHAGGNEGEVLANGGAVGYQPDVVRGAGRAYLIGSHGFTLGIVGHDFEAAGRVLHVVPHQAVARLGLVGRRFGLAALALAIHK